MMAAIQPYISGGISKTVNLPAHATVEDIAEVYMRAWELGLKCVAAFRDGCKLSQPAASHATEKGKSAPAEGYTGLKWGERKRLDDERQGITHKTTVGGQDAYFHVGLYKDGTPGEIFIDIAKAGSTLHGVMDMASMLMSVGLQHGVPLEVITDKLKDLKFEPDGMTRNKAIPFASSIPDYLGKWLEQRFVNNEVKAGDPEPATSTDHSGPPCKACGSLTIRAGSCWCCNNCGSTTGCG
jgi:ribonucleoside-diphosphate reductase alpha chain